MKNTQKLDAEIYRAYTQAKADPTRNASEVCDQFGISRQHLYNVVKRVRGGDTVKIDRSIESSRLSALWDHKYMARWLAMPKGRKQEVVTELKELISEMKADGFPVTEISLRLKKDRSTIIHHIEK